MASLVKQKHAGPMAPVLHLIRISREKLSGNISSYFCNCAPYLGMFEEHCPKWCYPVLPESALQKPAQSSCAHLPPYGNSPLSYLFLLYAPAFFSPEHLDRYPMPCPALLLCDFWGPWWWLSSVNQSQASHPQSVRTESQQSLWTDESW